MPNVDVIRCKPRAFKNLLASPLLGYRAMR
jgi:hypothetical protein